MLTVRYVIPEGYRCFSDEIHDTLCRAEHIHGFFESRVWYANGIIGLEGDWEVEPRAFPDTLEVEIEDDEDNEVTVTIIKL